MYGLHIFSISLNLLFAFCWLFPFLLKFFKFDVAPLVYFCFVACAFGGIFKTSENFSTAFFYDFIALNFMLCFKSILAYFSVWYEIRVQFHSFVVSPTPFVEETIFSFHTFVEDHLTICVWIYCWLLKILFHWSICLSLHQYHTLLITEGL